MAEKYRELTPIVRSKDKKTVLDRVKELLDEVKPAQWKTEGDVSSSVYLMRMLTCLIVPQEVLLILRAILESVKILKTDSIVQIQHLLVKYVDSHHFFALEN